jgi:TP901 family phage tail tape measure protein
MGKKVVIQIIADAVQAIASIKGVGGALDNLSGKAKNVGGKISDFGKGLGAVTTVPIIGALGAAAKVALDFDTQMGDAGRALDLSAQKMIGFKKEVLNAAPALGMLPTKFAEIATEAGKLGVASDKILDFSKLVAKGAMATGADAVEMAKNLAALQTITGATIPDLEKLVATANKIDDAIGGSTPEILEFTRQTAASGKLLKISTKELAAYGGTMQSLGIQNAVAYRAMGKMMTTLGAPQTLSKAQMKGLNDLGISAEDMAARMKVSGSGGIQFFLGKIREVAKTDAQRALGAVKELIGADFGDEVLTSALALDKLQLALKYAGDDSGNLAKFQDEVNKKLKGNAGQIEIFKANLAKTGIIIGSALLPPLNQLLTTITPLIDKFGKFAEVNPKMVELGLVVTGLVAVVAPLIVGFGMVVGALGSIGAAVGSVIGFLGTVAAVIGTVVGVVISAPGLVAVGIAAAVAAIAYAGYQIVQNWDWIKQQAVNIWNATGKAFNNFGAGFYRGMNAIGNWGANMVNGIVNGFSGLGTRFNQIAGYVVDWGNWIIKAALNAGTGLMQALGNGIYNAASYPFKAIQDIVTRIRAYLPGSDAEMGALSDLTASGKALPATFAAGMINNTSPVSRAASATSSAAMPAVSRAPALASAGGGGGTVTFNFQPNIEISNGATKEDARLIIETLRPYARELQTMISQFNTREARR